MKNVITETERVESTSFESLKNTYGDNKDRIFHFLNLKARMDGKYENGYMIFYSDNDVPTYKLCFSREELFFAMNYIIHNIYKNNKRIKIIKLNNYEVEDNYLYYDEQSLDVLIP